MYKMFNRRQRKGPKRQYNMGLVPGTCPRAPPRVMVKSIVSSEHSQVWPKDKRKKKRKESGRGEGGKGGGKTNTI